MKAFASWHWEDDKLTSGEQDDPIEEQLELKEIMTGKKGGDDDPLPPAALTDWPSPDLQEQIHRALSEPSIF